MIYHCHNTALLLRQLDSLVHSGPPCHSKASAESPVCNMSGKQGVDRTA